MPILDLQRRLHEAGRIRIGKTVPGTQGKKGRPVKLETFRFTTRSADAAKFLADRFGGEAKPWQEAPTDRQWEVISESDAIRVMVPPEAMGFSQNYELWKAGGCERRCDGFERVDGKACLCDPENRECKPHTRLSVMLKEMPTSGLWRLDTSGFYAATELAGGFELARLLAESTGRAILGATLRLEQREVKRPGQGVKKFAVPVLDFDVDAGSLIGEASAERQAALPAVTPVPALPAPTLADEIKAVENPEAKPQRKNAAPAVKATGLKPKPRTVIDSANVVSVTPDGRPHMVDVQSHQEVAPPTPEKASTGPAARPESEIELDPNMPTSTEVEGNSPDMAVGLAEVFDNLTGEAQSLRWMVLRNFGWDSAQGNDVVKWARTQPKETLTQVFDKLMEIQENTRQ